MRTSNSLVRACHFVESLAEPELFPYGIYTIPGISTVGRTEETLTSNRIPYEVGEAKYSLLAKSMMLGDEAGMLRLLFDPHTRKLLGVHAIGQRATEIIPIGQAVLFYGGVRDMVFNYPTLAEGYKVAALDGLNKLWQYSGVVSLDARAHKQALRTGRAVSKKCLARQPQRIPNRLEHCPLMAGSQDVIPIYQGWGFHDCTPLAGFSAWLVALAVAWRDSRQRRIEALGAPGRLNSIGTVG